LNVSLDFSLGGEQVSRPVFFQQDIFGCTCRFLAEGHQAFDMFFML
jgi:hypothetical protein